MYFMIKLRPCAKCGHFLVFLWLTSCVSWQICNRHSWNNWWNSNSWNS